MSVYTAISNLIKEETEKADAMGHHIRFTIINGNQVHITTQKKGDTSIDGHLWVERDGKIIDNVMTDTNEEHMRHRHIPVYLPAPSPDMDEYIASLIEERRQSAEKKGETLENWYKKAIEDLKNKKFAKGDCMPSSFAEQRLNGGKLQFGFMGFYDREKNNIFWTYGHPHEPKERWNRCLIDPDGPEYRTLRSDHKGLRFLCKQKSQDRCMCGSGKKYKDCCKNLIL